MPGGRPVKWLCHADARHAEELARRYRHLSVFLGDWLCAELRSAKGKQGCHVFVGFLASPHGRVFATNVDRMFESLLAGASGQCHRLRKKLTDTNDQAQFLEALFELEVASLFLRHKHEIVVEPTGHGGPDLKVVLCGKDVYIEAKKLAPDADQQSRRATPGAWARAVSRPRPEKDEWNLYGTYLERSQFPDDGYHVMVIDTFRRIRGAELLSQAWENYCNDQARRSPSRRIDVLIVCCRGDQEETWWLDDLTAGASLLRNPSRLIDDNVLSALKDIVSSQP